MDHQYDIRTGFCVHCGIRKSVAMSTGDVCAPDVNTIAKRIKESAFDDSVYDALDDSVRDALAEYGGLANGDCDE